MASPSQWLAGARPRTLPAALAPVLVGTGVAAHTVDAVWWKAAVALVVALALQIAVNYANDYSDGIRGTDEDRVGPLRLVGSGLVPPEQVKRAAFLSFGVAAVAGLALAVTTNPWLIAVGVLCILAAWFYTGGSKPYGYLGLGEVMVFVFFGLVAVMGTTYVQTESTSRDVVLPSLYGAIVAGAMACAILVLNNLRDIPTDRESGKITLAVRLGDGGTRRLFAVLIAAAAAGVVALAASTTWWALVGLVVVPMSGRPLRRVLSGADGRALIPALAQIGMAQLGCAVALFVALVATA
ncbi:1,4-dihydroxy-2-naphthoate polyprenyltransferase [Nocardioides dubius]